MASTSSFPPPIIIPPLNPTVHTQTFIILHGRGSSSSHFANPFTSTAFSFPSSSSSPSSTDTITTLRTLFPTTKFIFPSAPYSRATIYRRSLITQWFDSWHLDGDDSSLHHRRQQVSSSRHHPHHHDGHLHHKEEWRAIPGLQATVSYLHEIIREEAKLLSPPPPAPAPSEGGKGVPSTKNIYLGGISQGCAASLVALLLWDGEERLGGYLGMCGWLPFAQSVKEVIEKENKNDDEDDEWDPFQRDGDDEEEETEKDEPVDISAAAVRALRESLDLDSEGPKGPIFRPASFDTPVFLGHGDQDQKVPLVHGKEAAECLKAVGFNTVSWNEYQGLGHWYSPQMLAEIATLLKLHNTPQDEQ